MKPFHIFFTILWVLFSAANTPACAQFSLETEISPAIPFGDFRQDANFGAGFNLTGRYTFSKQTILGFGFGFYRFNSRVEELSYGINPITARIEYLLRRGRGFTPYLGGELGAFTFSERIRGLSVSNTYFGVSPAVGFLYSLSDRLYFDGRLQYSLLFSGKDHFSILPISLGLRFSFTNKRRSPVLTGP